MKLPKLSILTLLAILSLAACDEPKLEWNGAIYVGSSEAQAVVSKIDGEIVTVPANDPRFDEMVCTDTFGELQRAYEELLKRCKKWK